MHLTPDVSLGLIISTITIVMTIITASVRIGWQIGAMQVVARMQGDLIVEHTTRLDKYETRLVEVVSQVQRMIGRLEATQDRLEKITGRRPGEDGH